MACLAASTRACGVAVEVVDRTDDGVDTAVDAACGVTASDPPAAADVVDIESECSTETTREGLW